MEALKEIIRNKVSNGRDLAEEAQNKENWDGYWNTAVCVTVVRDCLVKNDAMFEGPEARKAKVS